MLTLTPRCALLNSCRCPKVLVLVLILASVSLVLGFPGPQPEPGPQQGASLPDDLQRLFNEGLRQRGGEEQRRNEERRRLNEENRRQQEQFRIEQAKRERRREEEDARIARNKWAANAWSWVYYVTFSVVGVIIAGLCCFFCVIEFAKRDEVQAEGGGVDGAPGAGDFLMGTDPGQQQHGPTAGGFIFPTSPTASTIQFTPVGGQPCTFTPPPPETENQNDPPLTPPANEKHKKRIPGYAILESQFLEIGRAHV